jgi:serine/threonine-protein kinase RsbW
VPSSDDLVELLAGSPGRLVLTAPATPEVIDLAHVMLEHLHTEPEQATPTARMRFEMAVIEVLGNIVEHAYSHDASLALDEHSEGRRVEIRLALTPDHLVASLSDNGRPVTLDLEDLPMPDEMAESGRGLALASAALDVFEFERIGDHNHWRMACRLS